MSHFIVLSFVAAIIISIGGGAGLWLSYRIIFLRKDPTALEKGVYFILLLNSFSCFISFAVIYGLSRESRLLYGREDLLYGMIEWSCLNGFIIQVRSKPIFESLWLTT